MLQPKGGGARLFQICKTGKPLRLLRWPCTPHPEESWTVVVWTSNEQTGRGIVHEVQRPLRASKSGTTRATSLFASTPLASLLRSLEHSQLSAINPFVRYL